MKTLAAKETVETAGAARAEPAVPNAWAAALAAAATAGLLYAASCKLALFADLAYGGSDWSSVLQMSKSFRYTGIPLYDNIYGYGAAIHNNYLLLLFFPLTYPLGAYGLILGLLALHALAIFRLLRTPVLSFWGRLAVLAAVLSPVSFWILDDPTWGFHVELCNLPLGVLLTLALLERRWPACALLALALCLVKEDGAILVAAVLLAYFLARLVREGPTRPLLRGAGISLAACLLVFLAGLALLHVVAGSVPTTQFTGDARIFGAVRVVARTLGGAGTPDWSDGLWRGLGGWALLALACGLPLLRRRCLARELPRDFPMGTVGPQSPLFHHQALVFLDPGKPRNPSQPPGLVVVMAKHRDPPASPLAHVRRLYVTGDPQFVPLLRRCGAEIAVVPPSGTSP